jgi:hypothetical protein
MIHEIFEYCITYNRYAETVSAATLNHTNITSNPNTQRSKSLNTNQDDDF